MSINLDQINRTGSCKYRHRNEVENLMNSDRTVYYKPRKPQSASLLILDNRKEPVLQTLKGNTTIGRNYKESTRDIRISSSIVSREHGEFINDDSDGSFYYIDNNSLNGTFINGQKLLPYNQRGSKAVKLCDGDIIRIDRDILSEPHPEAVLMIFSTSLASDELWRRFDLSERNSVAVGRGLECDLRLNDIMVSKRHAVLEYDKRYAIIRDNDSTNGICVNGNEIEGAAKLFPNDVIRMGNTILIYNGNALIYNAPDEKKASLIVDIKDKTVASGKVLIKKIKAEFCSGDFVLILGSSGAGKTTLINSILGESKANGRIILNGQDLYKNFKSMKSQIDMVPQFLTLRKNDTVRDTLSDTAAIKVGSSLSKRERAERIESVMKQVGILEHADKLIGNLSGGQQKKVAVANQLIGFQKVFICDEPDSGLDAASRTQQMEILQDIAEEGKIVIVISHEPDDAVSIVNGKRKILFNKVLVLARSLSDKAGHLAFFGSTQEALAYFEVDRLQDIMIKINPKEEGGMGLADKYIRSFETQKRFDNNV